MHLSWLTTLALLSSAALPTFASTFTSSPAHTTRRKARGGVNVDHNVSISTGDLTSHESFWLEKIKHQGISAFNAEPHVYQVFRNVKDFGVGINFLKESPC